MNQSPQSISVLLPVNNTCILVAAVIVYHGSPFLPAVDEHSLLHTEEAVLVLSDNDYGTI